MDKKYVLAIANEIRIQIMNTAGLTVFYSWGVAKQEATVLKNMPGLVLHVQGLLLKGKVFIMLDKGTDTYTIFAQPENGELKQYREDVYFDELWAVLDGLIEKDPKWTKEEYRSHLLKQRSYGHS